MSTQFIPSGTQKQRTFTPVILFHNHKYVKDNSGDLANVSESYGNPSYDPSIESHKRRIHRMLEDNGRFWADIIALSRERPTSPVSSLASSPTSPLSTQDLPSPSSRSSSTMPHTNESKSDELQLRKRPQRLRTTSSFGPVLTPSSPTSPHASPSSSPVQEAGPRSKKLCAGGAKRRRGNLPKPVTAILRNWLSKHRKHPYPTEDEKMALARQTNLTLNQISNWFINARRRILLPMLSQEYHEHHDDADDSESDMTPYAEDAISGRRGSGRKRSMSNSSLRQSTYITRRRSVASIRQR